MGSSQPNCIEALLKAVRSSIMVYGKQALSNPKFQAKMSEYPASVKASPHLFKKIAVPGICVE